MLAIPAASASADSLTVSAQPTGPGFQALTVNADAAEQGNFEVFRVEVGTACAPAEDAYADGPVLSGSVPAGSSTQQLTTERIRADVRRSHLCSYLARDTSAQTATADTPPLRSYGDVAGFNYGFDLHSYHTHSSPSKPVFQFGPFCGVGAAKGTPTDTACLVQGRLRISVSEKARKRAHFGSRTILDRAFSQIQPAFGSLPFIEYPNREFQAKLRRHPVPVTVTVTFTAPVRATLSHTGALWDGKFVPGRAGQ